MSSSQNERTLGWGEGGGGRRGKGGGRLLENEQGRTRREGGVVKNQES